MKRAIIFSGPMASGKTWISLGIKDFFEAGEWIYTSNHRKDLHKQDLTTFKLVILDECESLKEISTFERLRKKYPHCNFIFLTLSQIKRCDPSKYHLVILK